ncbi:DNA internalization-related competence protein ComEC/Rec2 [Acholeplasma vituli]|uniref:DNA internalization-related competence protein ComEC/Rec2 n=1 Tax=Paracholeplasma vituli TaxID=69473 RepID=A0ABT2PXE5_9MOLU|nr:DNA internalization-related competence protein ComEC/Rec2 [Paracholeplasma vituli]MCU0105393.1 DNA internalization-related competence protein ComEC/Rec2 [Paracholeplasma vituli]
MNKLKRLLPSSHIHLYLFGIVLFELSIIHYWISILGVVYLIWIRKLKCSKAIYIILIIYASVSLVYKAIPKYHGNEGVIIRIETVKSGYRYTLKDGLFNVHLYTKETLKVGDVVLLEGRLETYETSQFKGDFSPNTYFKSRFIEGVYYQPKIEVIDHIWAPHEIHNDLNRHIETLPEQTQIFVKSLFLGVFETDQKEGISKVGITHLFVLSGLHVTVLIGLLNKLLFFIPKRYRLIIESIVLFSYLVITLFPISLIRAVLQYVICEVLNYKKFQYTRLDAFSFTGIMMLIINPYFIHNMGFQLTFIVSFIFLISTYKSDFVGQWCSTFFAQTAVLPITSKITNQVYPIGFFVSPFFIPLFTYVLMPLSWVSLYRPIGEALNPVFSSVMTLIQLLETNALGFSIPRITGVFALIYFGLWIYLKLSDSLEKGVYRFTILVIFILIFPYYKAFDPTGSVTFLSVGQGDTTIIRRPYGSCTVVIDTFGDVVDYLNQNHIREIDYLVLTHGDYDHDKEANAILEAFEVRHLVVSLYHDVSPYKLNYRKLLRADKGDELSCGDIELSVLAPIRRYQSSNDQSIVLQTNIEGTRYLFTGDVEFEAEQDLVQIFGQSLQSDILKVGHHGSKSSTNVAFLKSVNPKIAVVSVGNQNYFGHPHKEVINRLNKNGVKIYQTNVNQTITFWNLPFYRRYLILVHKPG